MEEKLKLVMKRYFNPNIYSKVVKYNDLKTFVKRKGYNEIARMHEIKKIISNIDYCVEKHSQHHIRRLIESAKEMNDITAEDEKANKKQEKVSPEYTPVEPYVPQPVPPRLPPQYENIICNLKPPENFDKNNSSEDVSSPTIDPDANVIDSSTNNPDKDDKGNSNTGKTLQESNAEYDHQHSSDTESSDSESGTSSSDSSPRCKSNSDVSRRLKYLFRKVPIENKDKRRPDNFSSKRRRNDDRVTSKNPNKKKGEDYHHKGRDWKTRSTKESYNRRTDRRDKDLEKSHHSNKQEIKSREKDTSYLTKSKSPKNPRTRSKSPKYPHSRSKSPKYRRSRSPNRRRTRSRSPNTRSKNLEHPTISKSPKYPPTRSRSPKYQRSRSPNHCRTRSRSPNLCNHSESLHPDQIKSRNHHRREKTVGHKYSSNRRNNIVINISDNKSDEESKDSQLPKGSIKSDEASSESQPQKGSIKSDEASRKSQLHEDRINRIFDGFAIPEPEVEDSFKTKLDNILHNKPLSEVDLWKKAKEQLENLNSETAQQIKKMLEVGISSEVDKIPESELIATARQSLAEASNSNFSHTFREKSPTDLLRESLLQNFNRNVAPTNKRNEFQLKSKPEESTSISNLNEKRQEESEFTMSLSEEEMKIMASVKNKLGSENFKRSLFGLMGNESSESIKIQENFQEGTSTNLPLQVSYRPDIQSSVYDLAKKFGVPIMPVAPQRSNSCAAPAEKTDEISQPLTFNQIASLSNPVESNKINNENFSNVCTHRSQNDSYFHPPHNPHPAYRPIRFQTNAPQFRTDAPSSDTYPHPSTNAPGSDMYSHPSTSDQYNANASRFCDTICDNVNFRDPFTQPSPNFTSKNLNRYQQFHNPRPNSSHSTFHRGMPPLPNNQIYKPHNNVQKEDISLDDVSKYMDEIYN